MKDSQKFRGSSCWSSKFTSSKQEWRLLIITSLTTDMCSRRSSRWTSFYFTAKSSRRVRELRQPIVVGLSSISGKGLRHLTSTKKCSTLRTCSSKFKRKEPRRGDPSLMKTLGWRYVIWVMGVGHIITFRRRYKQGNIGHRRLLLVQNIILLLITGP